MLRSRQKFQNMAARVTKVKPPAAFARVQLSIVKVPGFASVRNPGLLHALKDRIEIKGQLRIDSDRSKVPGWTGVLKSEDLREKTCSGLLIMRRHDSVIQRYTHDRLLVSRLRKR